MFTTSARLYHDDVNASRGKLERGSWASIEQPVRYLHSLLISFALPVMQAVCTKASMWLAHCKIRCIHRKMIQHTECLGVPVSRSKGNTRLSSLASTTYRVWTNARHLRLCLWLHEPHFGKLLASADRSVSVVLGEFPSVLAHISDNKQRRYVSSERCAAMQ